MSVETTAWLTGQNSLSSQVPLIPARQVAAASLEPKTLKNELVPALLDSFCVSLCSEPGSVEPLQLLFMLASGRLASTRLNGFLRQLGIFMASFDWTVFGVETEGSPDERAATIHCRCWRLAHKERRPRLAPHRTFSSIWNG